MIRLINHHIEMIHVATVLKLSKAKILGIVKVLHSQRSRKYMGNGNTLTSHSKPPNPFSVGFSFFSCATLSSFWFNQIACFTTTTPFFLLQVAHNFQFVTYNSYTRIWHMRHRKMLRIIIG